MIRLFIAIGLAISMAACPLRPAGSTGAAHEDASGEERAARGEKEEGEASGACGTSSEATQCNGVDEDCDGRIDEGCAFYLGGHLSGGGVISAQDDSKSLAGGLSSQHFLGRSSDGSWVIHAGLISPEGGPR